MRPPLPITAVWKLRSTRMARARNPARADGTITAEQLERALGDKQAAPERRLGEILVDQGVATRAQIARVLAEQHELEYLDLEPSSIEVDVVGLLPETLARRYNALPMRMLEDGSVLMAVADPTNVLFYDELRLALGITIRLGVASVDAIEASIARLSDEVSIEVAGTRGGRSRPTSTTPRCSISTTRRRPSSSSTVRSAAPWTWAPPTSTSRRRRSGSSFVSASTASCGR